ncbi:DEAD/DEAH box helicase [Methylococcus sp. EFPC2]|uniref:DEAD/DEAH box helicase n=1 Tax=Methylococcus sp. EFPC2 TaxID=2812648 RepID=UPI0019678029|nr:DEAD/DEAH box helicase [Methylococcus sp. EFPC2]QSA97716.1 DEAD/DEAH box helicase [Methylococcus sp. EFPC2]
MKTSDQPAVSGGKAAPFTLDDLTHWLGANEIAKGRAYLNSIRQFERGPGWFAARIQGTGRNPYEVVGAWSKARFEAECSCPVGRRCKHIAAGFLHCLEGLQAKPAPVGPRASVLEWLEEISSRPGAAEPAEDGPRKKPAKPQAPQHLLYFVRRQGGELKLSAWKARLGAEGLWQASETWANIERALKSPPKFVGEEDMPVLLALYQLAPAKDWAWSEFTLTGEGAAKVLEAALATGRLLVSDREAEASNRGGVVPHGAGFCRGEPRRARLSWRMQASGHWAPEVCIEPGGKLLLTSPLWYVDFEQSQIGTANLEDGDGAWLDALMHAPALTAQEAPLVAQVLREKGLGAYAPPAEATARLRVVDLEPVPVLRLASLKKRRYVAYPPYFEDYLDYARLLFAYGEHVLEPGKRDQFMTDANGDPVQLKRHAKFEAKVSGTLKSLGFKPQTEIDIYLANQSVATQSFGLARPENWVHFMTEEAARLREQGWRIEPDDSFRHAVMEIDAWHGELEEGEDGWFSLAMGIEVGGQRLALQPLLSELFSRDARWLAPDGLKTILDKEPIVLLAPGIGRIGVQAGRLKPIVRTLIDLFDRGEEGEHLKVSRWDAARLEELALLADKQRWQFKGQDAVVQLAERLNGKEMPEARVPAGLHAQLRPYQLDGLRWLQYLRSQDLSGVLADDMGLGKTAQTIAHLLSEQEAGRLDRPALVVMPTSLLFNWAQELTRFAPSLKTLTLHGLARKDAFAAIPEHDVVLTTYPLLWRDAEVLKEHQFHLLILDEAQTVKNAASKAAGVVRRLQARHRLALTGTPLENHLGELWALFDYLLPGFLGDGKDFAKRWRTPIEKHGDRVRAELLARRVRPFILRRRKEDVAKELPPKTVIVRTVELEAAQRDLYETVRVAMDDKVRQEIADKGYRRSHIVILDALLKLRQVCCDPGLVKLPAARRVKQSAKLELLMEMLPELIDEGRRILLFSQFTAMLELIEAQLDKLEIPYVKLTGDTKDRAEPVQQFQAGKVPLFLISLKAGGVGLNLTAADTVIHYDPWWNPAVENQATDRAHRIGQDKNVFVYKLVVAGSIEEKIMALQDKKAALAAGILNQDAGELSKFNENDIAALLAPLPKID